MHIHHLGLENSVLNNFILELRSVTIQNDSMRFRRNIERVGEVLCYEMSKSLTYKLGDVVTPLGKKEIQILHDKIVICSILRAGLSLHQGIQNYLDQAENAFISAYRHHTNDSNDFEIIVEYLAGPSIEDKILLLADPMLASGQSFVAVKKALSSLGNPKEIHLLSVIAAPEGIEFVSKHFPENTHLWIATIDSHLNEKGYIIPGLGDAGDLAFGSKLQH
ncbi:uracil phosphoribosyltransferase [Imtechella halotolerans]|uniref:Uracil phosphoribosyltransferase n=1 Tax=Imtechella halotolerans K1 TaxID=946077 RepID=I0WJB3_9FLAO|nr:uracil phosphoribosyltransferase [Imtechella halotolerans]EID76479.1 uracil phosphoribosyltransferase [Imtechella halotolerans K1]WMQ62949.1 uracil phosphoribosyltransferase [Imtechella halotolerans]